LAGGACRPGFSGEETHHDALGSTVRAHRRPATAGPSVAATLTGVVTRADNGSPVAGARVLAAVADPFSIAAFGVTGAGGTFTLTVPAGT